MATNASPIQLVQLHLLLVTCIVGTIKCKLSPLSDRDETVRLSLARCIAEASENNFAPLEVITISLGPTLNDTNFSESTSLDAILLLELYVKQKWTLLVKQPSLGRPYIFKFNPIHFSKSDSYVLQLRAWIEIDVQLAYLKNHPSWNPHAKFIIVSATIDDNETHMLEFITRKLWKSDILNGVIVAPDKKNLSTFNIYSWFPFADGSCGDRFSKLKIIDSCKDGMMAKGSELFPNKLPAKMNNCTVLVRTLDYPPYIIDPVRVGDTPFYYVRKGLEAQLMNMVAQTCNIFMRYEIQANDSRGEFARIANQSTGLMGALVRGEADIAVASLSATWQRHRKLDSTSAYFQDSIGFCVPHADETSQWRKLSGVMSWDIWLGVTLTIVVMAVITTALSQQVINPRERNMYTNQGSVMQKVIAIAIGNSIGVQPRTSQVRLFLMLWIVFSFHLDTAYQTYLISALTTLEYAHQMKTVDDILDSDFELLFRPDDMKYFQGPGSTEQAKRIEAKWKRCADLDECVRKTAYKRNSVIAASRLYIQYARSSYLSKTGLPLLYCLQEQIVSFPVVAYMRHGFPLQHKVDSIISRINSAGYIQRFEADLFKEKKFAGGFTNDSYQEDDFLDVDVKNKLLTFEHMMPIFTMLFGGYCASCLILSLEVFVFKYGRDVKVLFWKMMCRKNI